MGVEGSWRPRGDRWQGREGGTGQKRWAEWCGKGRQSEGSVGKGEWQERSDWGKRVMGRVLMTGVDQGDREREEGDRA